MDLLSLCWRCCRLHVMTLHISCRKGSNKAQRRRLEWHRTKCSGEVSKWRREIHLTAGGEQHVASVNDLMRNCDVIDIFLSSNLDNFPFKERKNESDVNFPDGWRSINLRSAFWWETHLLELRSTSCGSIFNQNYAKLMEKILILCCCISFYELLPGEKKRKWKFFDRENIFSQACRHWSLDGNRLDLKFYCVWWECKHPKQSCCVFDL